MLTPPEWFQETLHQESNGKFRIRWSVARDRWQIEEKAARARMADRPISITDDEKIREYDGYTLFAEVAPGSRIKCDRCQRWMKVEEQQFKTSRCGHCRKEHKAFYWELSDSLLQHMRKVDPDRGGIERVFQEVDEKTRIRNRSNVRDGRNYRESVGKDTFNFVHDIQSVGYTGPRSDRFIHRDKGLR